MSRVTSWMLPVPIQKRQLLEVFERLVRRLRTVPHVVEQLVQERGSPLQELQHHRRVLDSGSRNLTTGAQSDDIHVNVLPTKQERPRTDQRSVRGRTPVRARPS